MEIAAPNQATFYTYDLLNNLTDVQQPGDTSDECGGTTPPCSQTRSFQYDSLSRLKQATNPESGTIQYTYDPNGNLQTKTDARGIVTTYAYDALNRVKTRQYTNEPGGSETPDVSYYYDLVTNAKGKLIKVASSVSTTEYTEFDILGRVTSSSQETDGVTYGNGTSDSLMTYSYNLLGAMIEQQYPSGRKVQNTIDANGDLEMVRSRKNANSGYWANANNFSYNAAGAVTSTQLGNGRWESTTFNERLQPTQIALGVTPGATNLLDLDYTYGTTANNGNVLSQTIAVPSVGAAAGFTAVQNYSYDSLNRLKQADEKPQGWTNCTSDPTKCWKQTFTFDRYGNRRFDEGSTTMPASFANQAETNPTISPNTNKLTSTGWSYDASGNTKTDPSGRTFIYDAENKQTSVTNISGTIGQYFYDGDGKRVKKVVPSTGETTVFVYDASGKLIAEYSTVVATATEAKVAYLTNDHLGSPRINTDANGAVTARHDYHPFGEEIATSLRTADLGHTDDTVRKQFTGYERESESGLDFAQARYYVFRLGRFGTTDPLAESAVAVNPQSWNRYSYTLNCPIRFTDPTGMITGDYYSENGTYLGWDGTADAEIHVVTNEGQRDLIRRNERQNRSTPLTQVASAVRLPSFLVRQATGAAVARTRAPTADDLQGNRHEEAFAAGPSVADGQEMVVNAPSGRFADLSNPAVNVAESDPLGGQVDLLASVTVLVHTHPGGEFVSEPSRSSGGTTRIGGGTTRRSFEQSPADSPTDLPNARRRESEFPGVTLVAAGVRNNTAYIYNGNGVRATFPLDRFITVTARRRP